MRLLILILVLSVVFVNGWTDAPNAIATAVGTGALSFRKAAAMAAVCNFAGAALSCLLFPAVALTVGDLVSFSDTSGTLTALYSTMLAIVLWATAAWFFGLPTSESHALLAGLSGSALALGEQAAQLNPNAWVKVFLGMAISLVAGTLAGRCFRRVLQDRKLNTSALQRCTAGGMSLLHGVQDGQKFMALFLLADRLSTSGSLPRSVLLLLTAGVMSLGTALGGRPIVKKVGTQLACLSPSDALASDLGAIGVLLICSALGFPVSTTHTKIAAICGAGHTTDRRVLGQILGAWTLTFPCCALLSFVLAKLMA